MPEGKQVQAPNVLPEPAREIWRAAFEDAWMRSCKSKAANGQREACSAAAAWAVVKEGYKKGPDDGMWVERTFAERDINIGKIPLPGSMYESPASAGLLWIRAYTVAIQSTNDIAESALRAWDALKSKYTNGADGVWKRNDMTIEPASVEAEEVEMAEPIVNRSNVAGASYYMEGTSILLDDVTPEQEDFYIREHGNELAERPRDWPWENWVSRNMLGKTVEAVIRHRRECRAYQAAVEREGKRGWQRIVNQDGSGEIIFKGWDITERSRIWMTSVLMCREGTGTDPDDWYLREPTSLKSYTLSARSAPGWRRFRGPVIAGGEARKRQSDKPIWVTRNQIAEICPPCAEQMQKKGLDRLNLRSEHGQMPKGTKEALCKKFGPDKGFFTRCNESMTGKVDDPKAYCAWLHNQCLGKFPGEHEK